MRTTMVARSRVNILTGGCALWVWSIAGVGFAGAQTGDFSASDTPVIQAPASQSGGLDMDVNPTSPIPAAPAVGSVPAAPGVGASLQQNVQDTASARTAEPGPDRVPSGVIPPPDAGQLPGVASGQPVAPEPVVLDHPTVVDTATFQSGSTVVALYGVEGVKGEMAEGLQSFLAAHGNHMTCEAQTSVDYVCLQADGTDVAEVALVNGAARTRADAPEPYRSQEAAAQTAQRGIWANLPPPPATVKHPNVADTATLVADGQTYILDGLVGLGAPFSGQLQGYIVQRGDSMVCNPQMIPGHYICVLPDGTDIAKAALLNGAARVAPDAPDSYRLQQAEALNNHRGFWMNQSQDVITASLAVMQPVEALPPGDDGADGIMYVGGEPTAVIDGETVFMTYGDDLGWGYYDHYHHWHGAPGRYRDHLEHYHPYGHGLRGYGHDEAFRHEAGFRREEGFRRDEGFRREDGFRHDAGFRPGEMHAEPGMHPGMAPGVRPGMPGAAMRPGMGAAGVHPAMAGGGFVHPGPSAAGFHPGGGAPMMHAAAPAMHAAAPAAHASSGGGGKHR